MSWFGRETTKDNAGFSMHQNRLESLTKTIFLGPTLDSESLGKALGVCFSTTFPGGAAAADP